MGFPSLAVAPRSGVMSVANGTARTSPHPRPARPEPEPPWHPRAGDLRPGHARPAGRGGPAPRRRARRGSGRWAAGGGGAPPPTPRGGGAPPPPGGRPPAAAGQISGFAPTSYILGVDGAL